MCEEKRSKDNLNKNGSTGNKLSDWQMKYYETKSFCKSKENGKLSEESVHRVE